MDKEKAYIPKGTIEYWANSETKDTNPEHFEGNENFINYMDDPKIAGFGNWMHSNGYNIALVGLRCMLDDVPSADVKHTVKAKWIRTESFVNGIVTRIYKCSWCDGVAGVRADNGFWYKSNFCPHCGAKMDEHGEG